jgi:uncharacterized protein (TIGR02145 family)
MRYYLVLFSVSFFWMSCEKNPSITTPDTMVYVSGNNQGSEINQQILNALKVQLLDKNGTAAVGTEVLFKVTKGGGSLSEIVVTSDENGYAETNWTLGNLTGIQVVEASCNPLNSSPIVFVAIGRITTSFTDSRDGEIYTAVTLGSQTWMAENLRYNATGSWLNPSNPSTSYGRLYDWITVMNGSGTSSSSPSGVQGICPSSWHLPSDAEWSTLEVALGMDSSDIARTDYRGEHGMGLKSTTGWSDWGVYVANNGNGTNASGFNVLPAGGYVSGAFDGGLDAYSSFWSSTDHSSTLAWYRILRKDTIEVFRGHTWGSDTKMNGFSCRCVKD